MVGAGYPNKTIAAHLGDQLLHGLDAFASDVRKGRRQSRAALVARVLEEELVFDERRIDPRSSS